MADHNYMIDKGGNPMVVCAYPALSPELDIIERLVDLAVPPALEALSPLRTARVLPPPIPVLIALPEDRPGRPAHLAGAFGDRLASFISKEVRISKLTCYPSGNAGGLFCMAQALSIIGSGESQICLVGGVDSYLTAETLEWLDDLDQLHSETTIWGFCPGEGAGFCLFMSAAAAYKLELSASVELLSAHSAVEANRIKTETVCIGEGLSHAFRNTLAILPTDIHANHTICDMNGEPYRGNEYGFAMMRSPGKFADDADFQTPADSWGDVGAASGPLFAVLAESAAKKQYAPGPVTFLWASSEGGLRAAALLRSTAVE
jgi:3-oxoacyl-[acyl-carrier-protein] synthase-1